MTTFAEKHIVFPDGQINVVPLPEAIMRNGFTPETRDAPGMPLPAQYLNWLMRDLYRNANELKEKSETLVGRVIPAWMPIPCPMEEAPEGYLKCNGAAFDKELYPELALGYPSGVLPDLRGEFIRGWDDGRGVDAGRGILTTQGDAIRNITGSIGARYEMSALHFFGNGSAKSALYGTDDTLFDALVIKSAYVGQSSVSLIDRHIYASLDASRAVPTAAENRPRNVSFNYIVRAA